MICGNNANGNSRPTVAADWATTLAGPRLSRRDQSRSSKVGGIVRCSARTASLASSSANRGMPSARSTMRCTTGGGKSGTTPTTKSDVSNTSSAGKGIDTTRSAPQGTGKPCRDVRIVNTGIRCACATYKSSNSSVDGSAHCRSSTTNKQGPPPAKAFWRSSRMPNRVSRRCGNVRTGSR